MSQHGRPYSHHTLSSSRKSRNGFRPTSVGVNVRTVPPQSTSFVSQVSMQIYENRITQIGRDYVEVCKLYKYATADNVTLMHDLEEHQSTIKELKQKITEKQNIEELSTQLNRKHEKDKYEISQNREQAEDLRSNLQLENASLQGKIKILEEDRDVIKSHLKEAQEKIKQLSDTNKDLEERMEHDREERGKLLNQSQDLREKYELAKQYHEAATNTITAETQSLLATLTTMERDHESETTRLYQSTKSLKEDNERLQDKHKHAQLLQQENDSLRVESERLQQQLRDVTREPTSSNRTNGKGTTEASVRELLSDVKELTGTDDIVATLMDNQSILIDRLAAEMNSKVWTNQSPLENISIQTRPMHIADEYSLLMSNAWLDAKSALDDEELADNMESFKVQLLCNVLMVSEKQAKSVNALIQNKLVEALEDAVEWVEDHTFQYSALRDEATSRRLPQALVINLCAFFRTFENDINLQCLLQHITKSVTASYNDDINDTVSRYLQLPDVYQFIKESGRLAWKMAIQRPQMEFQIDKKGKQWKPDSSLELMWGSNPDIDGARIQYYKTPRLLYGDKQWMKGTVFVHTNSEPK